MVRRRRPVHQPLLLRARTRLRTPAASWALAVLLGGLTFAFGRQTLSGAPASEAWGTPRAVVVATHPIAAGDPIAEGDLAVRELPADAIARGVVPAGEIASVVGSVARSPMAADEPVLANRVGTATDQGATTGASPRAVRVVSLPAGGLVPSLRRGDRVDVIGPSSAGTTERLAAAARVVAIDDDRVTVAVDERSVDAVAEASLAGLVVIARIDAEP